MPPESGCVLFIDRNDFAVSLITAYLGIVEKSSRSFPIDKVEKMSGQ